MTYRVDGSFFGRYTIRNSKIDDLQGGWKLLSTSQPKAADESVTYGMVGNLFGAPNLKNQQDF